MTARVLLAALIAIGNLGCGTEPGLRRSEGWAADLRATQQVLIMSLQFDAANVTGSGALSELTNVDSEALAVSGRLAGDSLHLTYTRDGLPSFRFSGRYAPQGLIGYLLDAEFDSVAVLFRPL